MFGSLWQGSQRSQLFLYMWVDHLRPGAASGEQQQRGRPVASQDALYRVRCFPAV